MSEELLDIRAAARLAGRHPETVRRWVWTGRLPARRRGNRLLVERAAVQALAGAGEAQGASLAAWRERVLRELPPGRGRSAADLVIEDRRTRSASVRGRT